MCEIQNNKYFHHRIYPALLLGPTRYPGKVSSEKERTSEKKESDLFGGKLQKLKPLKMAHTLRDRTDACLRALGVHTLRDMKQVEAPCAAEPLPDELRGWLGGDADELRELAECLAAWLGIGRGSTEDAPASSRPAQFWDVHIFKKVVFLKKW